MECAADLEKQVTDLSSWFSSARPLTAERRHAFCPTSQILYGHLGKLLTHCSLHHGDRQGAPFSHSTFSQDH